MKNQLNYEKNGLFFRLFSQDEDALLSFLNNALLPEHMLVKASFYQDGKLAVLERENSAIYIITCENEEGNRVEISVVLGMDESFEPMIGKTFMQMVAQNQTGNLSGSEKVFYSTMMFMAEGERGKGTYKRVMSLSHEKAPEMEAHFAEQKMIVYTMNQFEMTNPFSMEEVWLTYFMDTEHPLLTKHPQLPEMVVRAMDFANKK